MQAKNFPFGRVLHREQHNGDSKAVVGTTCMRLNWNFFLEGLGPGSKLPCLGEV